MDKKLDMLFSVVFVILTVPILGIALASITLNPVLILTVYASVLTFGIACAGLSRLEIMGT